MGSVIRAGAAGLALMASGLYLAWLPLEVLVRLPGRPLSPLPLEFGRRRCPTGLVLRRSAEGLAPVRALRDLIRETARRGAAEPSRQGSFPRLHKGQLRRAASVREQPLAVAVHHGRALPASRLQDLRQILEGRGRMQRIRAERRLRDGLVSVTGVRESVGQILHLDISAVIRRGQTVTVSYTDPTAGDDANALQDAAGNDVATFENLAVRNGSTVVVGIFGRILQRCVDLEEVDAVRANLGRDLAQLAPEFGERGGRERARGVDDERRSSPGAHRGKLSAR